jgi:hypothetical protein
MRLAHGTNAVLHLLKMPNAAILQCNNKKKRYGERQGAEIERFPMAYAESAVGHIPVVRERPVRNKRSVLRRLLDAIEQVNMQRAEREIARYLSSHGRKFTDESEREIERRFLSQR